MTGLATKPRRERVRLVDPSGAPLQSSKPRRPRVRLPTGLVRATNEPLKVENTVTPEALAYALPGGLAKLAYPKWMYAPFIRVIEDKVLQIVDGGKQIFVMFSAPPRHGKTLFTSQVLPAWFLGRFPDKRVLLVTYNSEYSKQRGRIARNIFEKHGQKVFGLKVAQDSSSASHWDIEGHEGGMEAVGAQGAITGKGAHLLIIDDPLKGFEEAMSETTLEKLWEWFLTDVYSRLEPGASVIILMTRWTLYDIIGRIQAKQQEDAEAMLRGELVLGDEEEASFEGWETINFPALAVSEDDVLGRNIGQALFPQRYNERSLNRIKKNMVEFWWEALYQGNPVPPTGSMIDINWLKQSGRQYNEAIPRNQFEMLLISSDTANKDTELADYTVFGIWGVKDGFYYLLDIRRGKFEFPELLATAMELNGIWQPDFFLIEDKGSGTNLIQVMRNNGLWNIRPIDPGSESKILRMQAETPVIRAGKVRVPMQASWLEDFFIELRSFPRGKKDQVDMFSQFLRFMRENSSGIQMW